MSDKKITGPQDLSPQALTVLDYLQRRGPLTPDVARLTLQVQHLARRIKDLKEAGYDVVTERKTDHQNRRYASYSLAT